MKISTKAIHKGNAGKPVFGEVSVPIYQCSTFAFPSADEGAARFSHESPGYIYTRIGNPTITALEDNVSSLEGGFGGIAASTGMAAITTLFLAMLESEAHIVGTDSVYGPTRTVLETEMARFGVRSTFVDTSDLKRIEDAITPLTKLVYVETPANPTMAITDIRGAAAIAHRHGCLLVVDNTFASPYLQRPIEHGADVVVHSMTKFINGHSDVVGGMIVPASETLYNRIKKVSVLFGGTMDPHQAWLVLRGVRTLPIRVEKSVQNAGRLASYLDKHPGVSWVSYPGLPSHPQHDIATRQMDGYGAIISFGPHGGLEAGKTLMDNVGLFTLAVSLGGVESLIEHPASMTHASVPREEREKAGIRDELVRLSVGCEDVDDLLKDLEQALEKTVRSQGVTK